MCVGAPRALSTNVNNGQRNKKGIDRKPPRNDDRVSPFATDSTQLTPQPTT